MCMHHSLSQTICHFAKFPLTVHCQPLLWASYPHGKTLSGRLHPQVATPRTRQNYMRYGKYANEMISIQSPQSTTSPQKSYLSYFVLSESHTATRSGNPVSTAGNGFAQILQPISYKQSNSSPIFTMKITLLRDQYKNPPYQSCTCFSFQATPTSSISS